jgi:hypothetical protein
MKKSLLLVAALAAGGIAQAQVKASPPAASAASAARKAAAPASAPVSAAKKAQVAQLLKLQQPMIEALARSLAERPALVLMQQAGLALQRLPVERREAVAREIDADIRKYADEAVPIVRDRAIKLAPSTIGALLEDRLSEAELKQVIDLLESPGYKKLQALGPEMQRAIGEKIVAETQPVIEPKVQALQQAVGKRLNAAAAAAGSAASK